MPKPSDARTEIDLRGDSRIGIVLSDRYRIDGLVDRGGMGRVYVGEHVLMHKRVAIKVLHQELTAVPEFVARFEREARAAANIDSDHVVAATDFGKLPDGAVFLVLEYLEGKNLRDEIAMGPIPLARALHLGHQIATALRAAHALGIVHRDLKPENVMLVEKAGDPDFVKVLDFGIAKVPIGEFNPNEVPTSKPITKAGMVFGTPEYMPPEQALGQDVDARADLYSLGVMLYEMLAGCRPFVAESQVGVLGKQLSSSAPPIGERAPGVVVPPKVERFIMRLLEREAAHRPASAQEVLDEMDRHLGYEPGRIRIPTLRIGTGSTRPSIELDEDRLPTRRLPGGAAFSRLEWLEVWIDERRDSLPKQLRKTSGPVLVSMPLGVLGWCLGFGVAAILGAHHDVRAPEPASMASAIAAPAVVITATPPTAPAAAKATRDELGAASDAGSAALVALAEKYPNDAAVRLALGGARLKEKDPANAVQALAEALALDPNLRNEGQVASALWVLAQNKKSSTRAFELLKGPMADRGAVILHDLTTTAGVRPAVRAKAKAALESGG